MNNDKLIKRGSIFYCVLPKRKGTVQRKTRPVMIIQNDVGNLHSPSTIVAPITSVEKKLYIPTHVYIGTRFGLHCGSTLLAEQITTVDKRMLCGFIGMATDDFMKQVDKALAISVGLDVITNKKEFEACLCSKCLNNFIQTHNYTIYRVNKTQLEKDTCTYCQQRTGFDYKIIHNDE